MKAKKPTPVPSSGSVRSDEVLTLTEFKKRFGLEYKSVATAQRAGLRLVQLGRQKYVLGSDVLECFRKLATMEDNDT